MNKNQFKRVFLFTSIFAAVFLQGCSEEQTSSSQETSLQAIEPCSEDSWLTAWCGYKNAEDLVATPDGRFLLATGFGGLPDSYINEMMIIDLSTMDKEPVNVLLESNSWGDPSCTRTSTDFSTHGMDLIERADGAKMVAVTNHLPKETIEFFELIQTDTRWNLVWRGCVESPLLEEGRRQPMFNDVALTADGGFYATEMYNAKTPFDELLDAGAAGKDSGQVWFWSSEEGFSALQGTSGGFPNGIVITPDESTLFVNYWFSGKTIKFDLKSAQTLAVHTGGRADNLTLSNGSLWAAKHDMSLTDFFEKCPPETTNCFLPFSIHKFDSDLNELKTWSFESSTFGFATVATPVGENVWLGTAHGDRIASFKISPQ